MRSIIIVTIAAATIADTDLASINAGTNKQTELFALGQAVLTELRLVTEKHR